MPDGERSWNFWWFGGNWVSFWSLSGCDLLTMLCMFGSYYSHALLDTLELYINCLKPYFVFLIWVNAAMGIAPNSAPMKWPGPQWELTWGSSLSPSQFFFSVVEPECVWPLVGIQLDECFPVTQNIKNPIFSYIGDKFLWSRSRKGFNRHSCLIAATKES